MSTRFFFETNENLSFADLREQAEKVGYSFGHMNRQSDFDIDFCKISGQPNVIKSIPMCCSKGTCDPDSPDSEVEETRLMTDGENGLVLHVHDGQVVSITRYYWCRNPTDLLMFVVDFYGVEIVSEYQMRERIYQTHGM